MRLPSYPLVLSFCLPLTAATWTVRLEEPTGLYPRHGEVVAVPPGRLGDHMSGFRVFAPEGQEVPTQMVGQNLLFQAGVTPGELPEYRVTYCDALPLKTESELTVRRVGLRRLELGNHRFRVVIDLGVPAITEAYNLSAESHRVLNLVETTPETPDKNDIHGGEASGFAAALPGENIGWTVPGAQPLDRVEVLESGPLRVRVRLTGPADIWDFLFTAGSGALRWTARRGFRFAAVAASPFLPFDRFLDGSEYRWPTGPDGGEPPDHDVVPRSWSKPPGGHMVFYRQSENYGALGIIALDESLAWQFAGSRRFQASKPEGGHGNRTHLSRLEWRRHVLEARRENRVLRQPLLVSVEPAESDARAQPHLPHAARTRDGFLFPGVLRSRSPPARRRVGTCLGRQGSWAGIRVAIRSGSRLCSSPVAGSCRNLHTLREVGQ